MEIPGKFQDYTIKGKLGEGTHSELFMATIPTPQSISPELNSSTGRSQKQTAKQKPKELSFAIKRISLLHTILKIEDIIKETNAMVQMKHPNIIQYHKAFFENSDLYIVMELCSGSIYDILRFRYSSMSGTKAVPVMKAKEVASVSKQILEGLLYIHRDGIIHRDIKSANMLFNESGLIKIADFGVCGKLNVSIASRETRTTFVGTPSYISPEVIMGEEYDQRADIWSFGIMCIEMASGVAPYSDLKPIKILSEILKKDPPSLETCSIGKDQFKKYPKHFLKFINFCLQKDPKDRKLCDELLCSDFITNLAKGPSYIASSILLNNTLNILEHKLESKEYTVRYNFNASDDEDEDQTKNQVINTTPEIDKLSMKTGGSLTKTSSSNSKLEEKSVLKAEGSLKKIHLILNLRNLEDNELQSVNFDVTSNDNWDEWANNMYQQNLILKEHIASMANALRLVIDNDFAALTFKLDKNADPKTLDKENLVGYVNLKVVKD